MKIVNLVACLVVLLLPVGAIAGDHIRSDGMGGYYTDQGHYRSDGMGGFYTPNGGHQRPDGMGGWYDN